MEERAVTEVAKASRALAKPFGKAIDAGREFGGWLNKIFGRALVNLIDLTWNDRIDTLRIRVAIYDYKKLMLLWKDTEKELARRGVRKIKPLAPKVLLPLIEDATIENEP